MRRQSTVASFTRVVFPARPDYTASMAAHPHDLRSRNALNAHSLKLFPDETLQHRIARAICAAGCLPRKEFFEAWEVAKRVRRRLRGGHVYDLAAGHGVVAAILLILDDSSPGATCVDLKRPPSQERVLAALTDAWPRLAGRITYEEADVATVRPKSEDLVVSVHACRDLTDKVLDVAIHADCRVAVLPCCHDLKRCSAGAYRGWMDASLAIDVARVVRMEQAGFSVVTSAIPTAITPKNRLLMATPAGWQVKPKGGISAHKGTRERSAFLDDATQ